MGHLPRNFTLKDEIYQIKDFSRDHVRVLLSLDSSKLDLSKKGVHRQDRDFPVIWARNHGKGRVLYNGLGHTREVWDRPEIEQMWLEMVQWSMGLTPADASPARAPCDDTHATVVRSSHLNRNIFFYSLARPVLALLSNRVRRWRKGSLLRSCTFTRSIWAARRKTSISTSNDDGIQDETPSELVLFPSV